MIEGTENEIKSRLFEPLLRSCVRAICSRLDDHETALATIERCESLKEKAKQLGLNEDDVSDVFLAAAGRNQESLNAPAKAKAEAEAEAEEAIPSTGMSTSTYMGYGKEYIMYIQGC